MRKFLLNPRLGQSQGEEIANSVSHGIGLIAALIGTPFLIINAVRQGDAGTIVGASVFSASMILLYLASALYHALPIGKAKRCFRIIEHSRDLYSYRGHVYTVNPWDTSRRTWLDAFRDHLGACHRRGIAEGIL